MRILVTGANGFVGGWLLRRLLGSGHSLIGGVGPGASAATLTEAERSQVEWVPLDLADPFPALEAASPRLDAIVHLAGAASVADSLRDPVGTWAVNALGTLRLLDGLGRLREALGLDPVVLLVSTAEVYGRGKPSARHERDAVAPLSPYAASKAAAEIAGLEAWRRTGLRVLVARPFPHTGPGQSTRFVLPAFVERIRLARRLGAPAVKTGNLEPVRDFLDVRDVAEAYAGLLEHGVPGEVYNVARGEGHSLRSVFDRIATLAGHRVIPERDPALARAMDIPHLVGDATKLRVATGWAPRLTLDQTLRQMLDAQTD